MELVDGVLRRLDERERAIVVLHYYLGLPLTDVSVALGIPIGTVKSRLHRALGSMRVAMADDASVPPSWPRKDSRHDHRTAPRARPSADPRRARREPVPRLHRQRPDDHGAQAPAADVDVPRKVDSHDDVDFTGGHRAANARCGRRPSWRCSSSRWRWAPRCSSARGRQVPQPFGRAANGLVAYAAAGDIFTVDPVTGVSTAIITGPETDINPRWSRDGTHLAFERKIDGDSGPGLRVRRPSRWLRRGPAEDRRAIAASTATTSRPMARSS